MLSNGAPLATAARHAPRSRPIVFAALLLCAFCVERAALGCASFPSLSLSPAARAPGPDPVALGGIRVRTHSATASQQQPTIVANVTIVYLAAASGLPVSQMPEQLVEIGREGGMLSPVHKRKSPA